MSVISWIPKTPIYKRWQLNAVLMFLLSISGSHLSASYLVREVHFVGLERTSQQWIRQFLPIVIPDDWDIDDIEAAKQKILTTGAFSSVEHRLERHQSGAYVLVFLCEEKHTTVPVLRGQFGGGTPLRVLGFYDIHTFGELITIGAELRQYGQAPPGWVAYTRAPRWRQGQHRLGAELWQDHRIREFYDDDDRRVGAIRTQTKKARAEYLMPVPGAPDDWRWGWDVRIVQSKPWSVLDSEDDQLQLDLEQSERTRTFVSVIPSLVFDDVAIDNLHYNGLRTVTRAGLVRDSNRSAFMFEQEVFAYQLFGSNLNLAQHGFFGYRGSNHLADQYFLGGFDSVRGLPDGALYGSKSMYGNLEARYLFRSFERLWMQLVTFADWGTAAQTMSDFESSSRSSAGFGVRLAIPQIYRMVFRIDYAFSLDRPGTQGISLGMNQLFQPYSPL